MSIMLLQANPQKHIPKEAFEALKTLKNAHFEAYFVGGCVRDILLGRKPRDWDITTNATPEQIIALFPDTFYENKFGTVGVVNKEIGTAIEKQKAEIAEKKVIRETFEEKAEAFEAAIATSLTEIDESLHVIEVTPYRKEGTYSDFRRPDNVSFTDRLEDDLARRDFTINAMAMDGEGSIVDIYKGQKDLEDGVIRTVGEAHDRFNEDALRILRAVRIATELGFTINSDTQKALENSASLLKNISRERIRDEFTKIIMSNNPLLGMVMAQKLGIIDYISPVFRETFHVEQGGIHSYDVWEHILRSLQHAADKKWPLDIRLAALFHDIAKPQTRRKGLKKWTFYGHEVVGERVTRETLQNLKFSKDLTEKVAKLVRWHMFFTDTETITLSAVRRLVVNVGKENVWDLMNLRICDRVGTGRPKEEPYRLRKYQSMIEEAMRDPVTVGMLKIDGNTLIKELDINPGPKIGFILHALLEDVLDNPEFNTKEYLENKAKNIAELPLEELKKLADKGKEKQAEEDAKELKVIRNRHSVQ